jgi:hypothetical protein
MSPLRTLRRLTPAKLRALVLAFVLVWAIRLGLWLLPFRTLRAAVARVRGRELPLWAQVPPEHIAQAIQIAGRLVPRATCLTKALAGHLLLRRSGYAGTLHIGVARDETEKFEAHAWLECEGRVIIGGGPRHFVPLPPIGMGE